MKRRRILYALPFAALILGGCTFNDVKSWVGQNIYFPVRNWIEDLITPVKPDDSKKDEKLTEQALLEAVDRSFATKNYTVDVYEDGESAGSVLYDDPSQLLSVESFYLYYEVVDNVTYTFYAMDEQGDWVFAGSEEGNTLGLDFSREDLEGTLHYEGMSVEYGKDYCAITYPEDAVLEDIISDYPDYEEAIRSVYEASEIKAGVKLIVKDGYITSMIDYQASVELNAEDTEGTSFVCETHINEEKFSKYGTTVVDRPSGITAIPPEETGSEEI